MPGSPNNKVLVGGAVPATTMTTGTANMKAALSTQDGLEKLQKLIEATTSPPVNVPLATLATWIAAIP